ncbi:MAG: phosphatase PAP2 family protein [Deltaproteobacteria bacterium]|nr:phosphatase PAP2 family protein [Deltaproteobacteria bacterium]
MLELTRNLAERARTTIGVTARNLAVQDVIMLAFHAYVFLRALMAPDSPDAAVARRLAFTLLAITCCALVLTRGEVIRDQRARALTYRLGLFMPMPLSYFAMRALLPALQPELVDYRLFAIDRWLLGTTPAIWMEAWNVKPVVEWLSFFYYGYFLVMALMLVPSLLVDRGRRQQEMLAGALLIVTCGHFLYTVVPGAGPVAAISFNQPLQGGFWWNQVELAVATAGAQLDIFPSLHTAFPVYFTLHAFAHRHTQPFRWLWPILAFVATNIIIATMFLRWHWFIDVVAGLLLAFAARRFAVALTDLEERRGRRCDDRQPVWERL